MTTIRSAFGALMLSGAAIAAAPAIASEMAMNVSYQHSDQKPCRFYVERDMPAPRRCYRAFYDVYGPQVFVRGGMVYRDREAFAEIRKHDELRDHAGLPERQQSPEDGSRYAENAPQDRDAENRSSEPSSSGTSYGHRSEVPPSSSGGASYGHHAEKPEPYSGGASSH